MAEKITLKQYLDYREYLRDYFAFRRAGEKKLTHRGFASAVGISSSSWLTNVINGQKGITAKTADAISDFLKHDDWERGFFRTLVEFNQSKTIDDRNEHFLKIKQQLSRKGYHALQTLQPDQYEYYSKWYFSAVRAILAITPIGDDYEKIARLVSPAITVGMAKKSIKVLKKLQLIKMNDRGFYELTNKAISSGSAVRSLAVANFQRETMRLGCEAIDRYNATERDISSLSVGVSPKSYEKITQIISQCRKAIAEIANNDDEADRVYQLNFQLYPLSKVIDRESDNEEK